MKYLLSAVALLALTMGSTSAQQQVTKDGRAVMLQPARYWSLLREEAVRRDLGIGDDIAHKLDSLRVDSEMALVKMYRVTGREDYLTLAKFLIDQRGPDTVPSG